MVFQSSSELTDNIVLPNKVLVEPGQSFQFNFNIQAPQWPEKTTLSWENLETKVQINFFNPSRLDSYQDNFWQKIIALVKVWWYKKFSYSETDYQENTPNNG